MLALHLLQICLVYINTLMIQRVLTEPDWTQRMLPDDLRALTPLHLRSCDSIWDFSARHEPTVGDRARCHCCLTLKFDATLPLVMFLLGLQADRPLSGRDVVAALEGKEQLAAHLAEKGSAEQNGIQVFLRSSSNYQPDRVLYDCLALRAIKSTQ
jgi:hypothetical protein